MGHACVDIIFQKEYQERTIINEHGYRVYKRTRSSPTTIVVVNRLPMTVGANWVVPYNPSLTSLLNAHVNVEICNSTTAIKYLHKYMHKGTDSVTVAVSDNDSQNMDEVKSYLNTRFLGPHEALNRIMKQKTHGNSPSVSRLGLHLLGEQSIMFDENMTREQMEKMLRNRKKSMLEA